jgi:hypothetical protein
MMTLINKSPTLRAQLNQLSDDITSSNGTVKQIALTEPSMPGSQYNARDNLLSIHPNDFTTLAAGTKTFSAEARFVGILVHEMGHRVDDANLDRAASIHGIDGKDIEFANIMVLSEGVSAANSFIIRKELLQTQENNTGPEIYFPGEKYNGTPGVLAGLTTIDNSTATWSVPDRLQVFSEIGANYLANVLTSGGTPPGTLTNWQANIDSSRAVRGLPASPAPQPNSIELVDLNNDGVIEFVKYRDFSNTCRREDYTTTAAGDHVTTQTSYTAGFDSVVASREVITTNAAGIVTTSALDSNADGTIDKTTTKLDADRNGIAERTTVAVTGGDTTVSADANQNGLTETLTVYHNNATIDVTQADEGTAAWSSIFTHYDLPGRIDYQTVAKDGGGYTYTVLHPDCGGQAGT